MIRWVLAISILAFSFTASADTGQSSSWYGELRGGAGFADLDRGVDLESGWLIEGATGFAHGSGFRGELAVGYRTNDLDDISGDIWAVTTMVNGYFDIHLDRMGLDGRFWSRLTPTVGAGVGAAFVEVDTPLGDADDITFAFQGIGGLAYDFTSQWQGTVTYNYFSSMDSRLYGVDWDYDSHNIMAGMRFRFR